MKKLLIGLLAFTSTTVFARDYSNSDYTCSLIDGVSNKTIISADALISLTGYQGAEFNGKKLVLSVSNDFGYRLNISVHDFTNGSENYDVLSSIVELGKIGGNSQNPRSVVVNSSALGMRVECKRLNL